MALLMPSPLHPSSNSQLGEALVIGQIEAKLNCRPFIMRKATGKELIKTIQGLVAELEKKARSIEGRDDVKATATISAGNDEDIGIMIADAIDKVGADGVLSIESSSS
ncbi:hypothetical protein IFM89_019558 [Coptis chinensis]|uniref:Uncharacterized protein n=1 Tax=Coptis chinensis TaxID=261450 RepID=A0A835I3S3_9MAGN|nr:hypothetical protein IFM89_019558 [Coptis chinensis]